MTLRIIAGKYKGRILKTPKGPSTRPTQGMLREAVFNICQSEIKGARVLDLFAGSGAMGFEALSRGASHVVFVEKNRFALSCIRENIALLQVKNECFLLSLDALSALKRLKDPFDLIYVDPPYDSDIGPYLEILKSKKLLSAEGVLFVEERHDPKRQLKPPISEGFSLIDSRRFGTALIHQYKNNPG